MGRKKAKETSTKQSRKKKKSESGEEEYTYTMGSIMAEGVSDEGEEFVRSANYVLQDNEEEDSDFRVEDYMADENDEFLDKEDYDLDNPEQE